MYSTLEEKTNAVYENEAVDRFVTELEDALDNGAFELPDEYEELTAEAIVKMATSVDRDTFIEVCRENLRQNAEMSVELLTETMEQIQEAYDGLDEDNRKQFSHTMTISTEAAVKLWADNVAMFKELIDEFPADQRAALVTNSANNIAYLRSNKVPVCVKPWTKLLANMWQLVYDLAT